MTARATPPTRASLRGLSILAVALTVGLGACSEDDPVDCGEDGSMALVTLRQRAGTPPLRWCVDIHAASRVDADAKSAGLDESFAVSKPSAYPWTNLTFREASEACGRAGKFLCDSDVLKLIAPTFGLDGNAIKFDTTTVDAVPANSDVQTVPHRLDEVNPYDMVIAGQTGKPPFPESTASVAFWTVVPEKDDQYVDELAPQMIGSISDGKAIGGYLVRVPVTVEGFKHPLLGFRCCIDAKLRAAFEPLARDPSRVRAGADPEVRLAPAP